MAYEIHLIRPEGQPITLTDWEAAVAVSEGVRLTGQSTVSVTNNTTGESLSAPIEGAAEVYDPVSHTWHLTFRLHAGRISTRAPRDFDDADSLLRTVMRDLALQLLAQVVGDEGEVYD